MSVELASAEPGLGKNGTREGAVRSIPKLPPPLLPSQAWSNIAFISIDLGVPNAWVWINLSHESVLVRVDPDCKSSN